MNTLNLYTSTNWLPKHSGNPAYMEHINDLIKKINEIITDDTTDNASLSGDNTFAGSNTFSENIQFAAGAYGVTALAGGGQTGATPLTGMFSSIAVCATNGDSCILPEALAGNLMIVSVSEVTVGRPQVFPAVGEQIDSMGANVPLTIASGTVVLFSCDTDGNWVSTSLYDINHIYNAINTAKVEVKPYDVYVALLTQTLVSSTSGSLVIGKTYEIASLLSGDDFANVGYVAPNMPFVATGETPTTWTHSTVVVNITDSAPTATILKNDFDEEFTYSYSSTGVYKIVSSGSVFTNNKTTSMATSYTPGVGTQYVSAEEIYIRASADDILDKSMLEIRVYP